jgi:hypothetical protein
VIIQVEDRIDLPLLRDLVYFSQNGLATSGDEIITLTGFQLGQEALNAAPNADGTDRITARYGQGVATVFETQQLAVAHDSGAAVAGSFELEVATAPNATAKVTVDLGTSDQALAAALLAVKTPAGLPLVSTVYNVTKRSEPTQTSWTVMFGVTLRDDGGGQAGKYLYGANLTQMAVRVAAGSVGVRSARVSTLFDGHPGYFLGDRTSPTNCSLDSSSDISARAAVALQTCRQKNLDLRVFTGRGCRVNKDFLKVQCQTGPGYGVRHLWQVTVSDQPSNIGSAPLPGSVIGGLGGAGDTGSWASQTTSYAPPTIISFDGVAKSNADTNGGQVVVLKGTQYGTSADRAVTRVTYGITGMNSSARLMQVC